MAFILRNHLQSLHKTQPSSSSFLRQLRAAATVAADATSGDAATTSPVSAAYGFDVADLATARPMSEIPGPRRLPLIGTAWTFKPFPGAKLDAFEAKSKGKFYEENYGQIVKSHFPFVPGLDTIIILLDPKDFNIVFRNEGKFPNRIGSPVLERYRNEQEQSQGLLFTNKEEWWRMRQPINKVMMRANAALPYLEDQSLIGDEFVELLKRNFAKGNGTHRAIMRDIYQWALESVCAVVYDCHIGSMDPNLPADSWQHQFIDSFNFIINVFLKLFFDPREKIMEKCGIRSKTWQEFVSRMRFLDETTLRLIAEAKVRFESSTDEENSRRFLPQVLGIESLGIKDKLSMIFDMMLAALDTTTYSLLRTLFFMSKHPETQDRLYEELMLHIGPPGTTITPTALSNLHYLKACVKESQRLLPLAPQNGRALPIDVVVKGYRIPAGTQFLVEHEYVSTSPKYFEDPLAYRPERWLRTDKRRGARSGNGGDSNGNDVVDPFMVLPFGFGPRMCVGRRFAEQELWIGLIKIIHSFKVEYDGDKMPLGQPGLDKHPILLDFVFKQR